MLFLLIVLYVAGLLYLTLDNIIFKGKWEWVIYFACFYFPFYTSILSIVYQATHSTVILAFFQYLKEIIVFISIISFIVYKRDLFSYPWRINNTDKLLLAFLGIGIIYLFIPLGEASFINKALYLKNIMLLGAFYFFGRNSRMQDIEIRLLFKGIMWIAIVAFVVNVLEVLIGAHFQQFSGYALFNYELYDIEPKGNYGLSWTFETQTGSMRLASFFSDPLELAGASLLGFSTGLIWYLSSKREEGNFYILAMFASVGSIFFSASRASFAALFIMIFFISVIFKLKKLLLFGAGLGTVFVLYILFLASDEFYYFIYDTITFQNASSVGHIVEWILALDAMILNPEGIGLAMSGNTGSVENELRVGGENQYLIFGVQMGVLAMVFYILLLVYSITIALKTFKKAEDPMIARVAFVAATVKFGMLLPLFTSNAENFLYLALISWWMVGYSVNCYHKIKYNLPIASVSAR